MKLSITKAVDHLIWILTAGILTTYILFETYTWGRYVFFGESVVIVLLSAFQHRWKLKLRIQAIHWFMLAFSGYCALSALWALEPADALQKGETVFQILVCAAMLYIHYQHEQDVHKLLMVVMWTGYFVSIYTLFFYGMDRILLGTRLNNDFSNLNNIGIVVALSCIIQIYEWLHGRHRWSAILMVPAILTISVAQSRTSMVGLLIGVFGVYVLKQRQGKDLFQQLAKVVWVLFGAALAVALVYSLPVFSGVRERMNSMLAGVLGTGETDNSTLIRLSMIDLGLEWFRKEPIGGIGIGCTHVLSALYLGCDTYLHNNFVELLCGGGLVGFCLYYAMYGYLLWHYFRYRNNNREMYEIGIVWLGLLLVMDYGNVSYYWKSQWFYLMIHFLNIWCLKKKSELKKNAT